MGKRRALGQHYLVDPTIVRLIIQTSAVERNERVLEIGTGSGVLTERLCKLTDRLEAFELDAANYRATKRAVVGALDLHLGDAFLASPVFDVLVSSLPYSESSNFVEWLSQRKYDRAVVILQKDFVEKLMSDPHEGSYRAISVIFQISSRINVIGEVDRASFAPPPRVSSVIVMIKPRETITTRQIGLVKMLFSQKKRKLGAALKRLGFDVQGIPPEKLSTRVWEFPAREIRDLLDIIDRQRLVNHMNE
jgi:16S rRNA (adenine1518-N6/adenine1519-N6)-dimethyltransferase